MPSRGTDVEVDHLSIAQSDAQTALELGGGELGAAGGGHGGPKADFSKGLVPDRPCRWHLLCASVDPFPKNEFTLKGL